MRRLAIIAAALTLAACSDTSYAPTEVSRLQNVDDPPPIAKGPCDDFAPATKALIPWCQDYLQ